MPELEDAPWATGGGDELPDAPWAKKPIAWSDIPGQALKNAPDSARKFIDPFLHPIDTVKGMAGLAGGIAEKAAPYAQSLGPVGSLVQGAATASKYAGGNEAQADEFAQTMKDRYGGMENIKHTLAEDPVGAAADLSTVLTGGGSLASRAPGMAGRVGAAVGRAGNYIDPLRPVTKGLEKVGELIQPVADRRPPRFQVGNSAVQLSEGQASIGTKKHPEGDLSLIQPEQAAARKQSGDPAYEHANEFFNVRQKREVGGVHDEIMSELDPHGHMVDDPIQAGAVVGQGLRDTYEMRRKVVSDHFYDAAKQLGGELDASYFDGIAHRIRTDLSGGTNPVIIEDRLTPNANLMLKDIEQQVASLSVPRNNASPYMHPSRSQIVGVSLEGVDQIRRRLAQMRDAAFKSGNAQDGAASQAVLRAFERDMDIGVNSPAFTGDPRAPAAWNQARAAHADVRATFGSKRGDSAGMEVEKILGRRGSAPASASDTFQAIVPPNLRASTKHVQTAERIKKALGEDSPEWAAVRQGTFSRLTETPPGMKDWGPGKVADRINKFLNGDGRELAEAIFTPQQRQLLQEYGELQRRMVIPQAGANWSNTSTFLQRWAGRALPYAGAAIGAGGMYAMGMPWLADIVGGVAGRYVGTSAAKKLADRTALKEVAPQLPLRARGPKKSALRKAQLYAGPSASRFLQNQPAPRWRGRVNPEPLPRRIERYAAPLRPSPAKLRTFGTLGRYANPYHHDDKP